MLSRMGRQKMQAFFLFLPVGHLYISSSFKAVKISEACLQSIARTRTRTYTHTHTHTVLWQTFSRILLKYSSHVPLYHYVSFLSFASLRLRVLFLSNFFPRTKLKTKTVNVNASQFPLPVSFLIHRRTHTRKHTLSHTLTHTLTQTHTHTNIYTHIHAHTYTKIHIHTYTHIYTHIHTDTQTLTNTGLRHLR